MNEAYLVSTKSTAIAAGSYPAIIAGFVGLGKQPNKFDPSKPPCEAGQLSATQRAELDRLKAVAEQERQQRHAAARTVAQAMWEAATPVKGMEHPYLDKKQVPGLNAVRVTADNVLLVPLRDTEGVLHSLIRIDPDGAKKLLEDADPRGHFGAIGPKPAGAIRLTEGIATALTVAVATGQATVCCGDAGNLKRVAAALRAKYPDQELIIAADLGSKGQQGAAAALGAAGPPARLLTPAHPQGGDGFDWNDLQRVAGLDEVRRQLLSAAAKAPGATATLSWPDPAPLPNEIPSAEPFLLELLPAAFRPWIADIADRLQCPADFPAIGAMVALAAVVGRKVGLRPKRFDDWLVIPNLWGCIVGRPGLLKSPALQEVMKPLQRLDREALERFDLEKVEAEALREVREAQKQVNKAKVRELLKTGGADHKEIAQLVMAVDADEGPVRRRYVVNDSTVEKLGEVLNLNPNGVLIFRDELLGWLASLEREGAEGSRQFLLEAWNGTGRFTFDRIGRGTIDIQACCLSILGSIQPGPLQDYLATAPDDGLMQRFQLAVWPDVSPDWKPVDRWPDRDAKQRVWERVRLFFYDVPDLGFPASRQVR